MFNGINLTLLVGPVVPVPVPQIVIEALSSIEVTSGKDNSGFQMTFSTAKNSPLLCTMLPAGYFDPIVTRVIIIVTLNGVPNVIMDGIVTQQQLQPDDDPGNSRLIVTGDDLSVAMDLLEIICPYPSLPDYVFINTILLKYAFLGIVPLVIPPFFQELSTVIEGWNTQTQTDLQFLKTAADSNGYIFYVEPGIVPGQNIAYFGPDIRIPIPQPALTINMDAHTNVDSLSISFNGLQKKLEIVTILDPVTGRVPIPLPIPEINIFKPPLGVKPAVPAKIVYNKDAATKTLTGALSDAIGKGMKSSASITVNGSLSVVRYGHILKSRMLVGVRGVGLAYDGLYYVDSVNHNIRPGEYTQSFTLSRDGTISQTRKVAT